MVVTIFFFYLGALLLLLEGCVSGKHPVLSAPVARMAAVPSQTNAPQALGALQGQDSRDLERLALLWQERKQARALSDYPLGPGDVLQITVPDLKEIQDEEVRVAGDGTIGLPLIGTIQANGLTEEALKKEIQRPIQARYMRNPQVSLFVREYRNRQVAVFGAVQKPGLYDLTSEAKTILDMLSLAGGLTETAAPRVLFIPAEPVQKGAHRQFAPGPPVQLTSQNASVQLLQKADPISIDLKSLSRGGNQSYLNLPARPGDVLMVPGGGEVSVDGWVENPGAYKISSGMTLLGAIAAAGGAKFAGNTSAVKIIRVAKSGEPTLLDVDTDKIREGERTDIPIVEGDIVVVSASNAKLVPYGIYHFFTSMFRVGASTPLF